MLMSWYLVLRFLHIASAMMFVGGLFARQIVRSVAHKTNDISDFAALTQGAGRIENLMVIPGNMAVIIFGVILAVITNAPLLGFLQGASQNWLLLSNVLLILGLAAVPLVFIPRGKIFAALLTSALAVGQITPQLRTQMNDPVVRMVHWYELISTVLIIVLMVFKPF
jgi:uncharacterized membrane protein